MADKNFKFCTACGRKVALNAKFCGGCGAALGAKDESVQSGTAPAQKASAATRVKKETAPTQKASAATRVKKETAPTQKASAAARVTEGTAPTQKRLTAGEWNDKGLALAKSDRNQEAIQYFDKALELDPKNVGALVNKGTALYALGRYEAALQCCYRTLSRDPKNAAAQEIKRAVLNKSAAKAPDTIGDSRAVEPLIRALRDSDTIVGKSAADALGKIGDPRAVEPLIGALRDSAISVRESAVAALGTIGDPAVEPLIKALDALVSCFRSFRSAENDEHEKERSHSYFSPLRKRLVLGTIIDRCEGAECRKA
jgi:tetratricopeptide (TPR) repeat protein